MLHQPDTIVISFAVMRQEKLHQSDTITVLFFFWQ
jgi:hypothetical protein